MELKVCNFKYDTTTIMVKPLSDIQMEYVNEIEEYKARYGKTPSVRTICKLVGASSPATVSAMLNRLKLKGYDYEILSYEVDDIDD